MITHDADVSITTTSGLTLRANITNFINEAVPIVLFDQTRQGFYLANYAPPRMFGAAVGYKW